MVIAALEEEKLLEVVEHPNKAKYPNQNMYVLELNDYIYLVLFIQQSEDSVFLKTIFCSRKVTKYYRIERRINTENITCLMESSIKNSIMRKKSSWNHLSVAKWAGLSNVEEAKDYARKQLQIIFVKMRASISSITQ